MTNIIWNQDFRYTKIFSFEIEFIKGIKQCLENRLWRRKIIILKYFIELSLYFWVANTITYWFKVIKNYLELIYVVKKHARSMLLSNFTLDDSFKQYYVEIYAPCVVCRFTASTNSWILPFFHFFFKRNDQSLSNFIIKRNCFISEQLIIRIESYKFPNLY